MHSGFEGHKLVMIIYKTRSRLNYGHDKTVILNIGRDIELEINIDI